uniref:Uncharacterized protein n=1 Tax=Trichuris muris TaxID=70415 RepID=A0A5S6QRI4_TRIMR
MFCDGEDDDVETVLRLSMQIIQPIMDRIILYSSRHIVSLYVAEDGTRAVLSVLKILRRISIYDNDVLIVRTSHVY